MNHNLSSLKKGAHVHLVGICGTAMASLAGLLHDRGFAVTGSDSNPYPPMSTQIEKLGIKLYKGYSAANLSPAPDFVIIGNVIRRDNPEAQETVRLNLPYTSLAAAMGEAIIEDRQSIVIAGTHGKTTTTSLMAWIAEQAGFKPGFLIGGIAKNFSVSFRNPEGSFFIIEGDEYDTAYFDKVPKFIHYRPRHVIFTTCEFDHADIYADLSAVKAAFQRLMDLIPTNGNLFYWGGDPNVVALAQSSKCSRFSYGLASDQGKYDFEAVPTKMGDQSDPTEFRVLKHGEDLGTFRMGLTGDFNILNATAAVALAHVLGCSPEATRSALASFQGVKRRQEILGEPGGVLLIEDFAHHPTAVRETLRALKGKYQNRKLWAVFEPRSATSRRKIFQNDYALAFAGADAICIAEAYNQTGLGDAERFSSQELVTALQATGKTAAVFPSADTIVAHLKNQARAGDVVVIMSNGAFDGIYQKLFTALAGPG